MQVAILIALLLLLTLGLVRGRKHVYTGPGSVVLVKTYTDEEVISRIDEKTRGIPLAWRPVMIFGFAWTDRQVSEEELVAGFKRLREGHTIVLNDEVCVKRCGLWVTSVKRPVRVI